MAAPVYHMVPAAVLALTLFAEPASAASDLASAIAAGAYDGTYEGNIKLDGRCAGFGAGPRVRAVLKRDRIEGYIRRRGATIPFEGQLNRDGRVSMSGHWKNDVAYNLSATIVDAGLEVALKLDKPAPARWSCRGVKVLAGPTPVASRVVAAPPQTPAQRPFATAPGLTVPRVAATPPQTSAQAVPESAKAPAPTSTVDEKAAPPPPQPAATASQAPARDDVPPVITAPPTIETEAPIIELAGSVSDVSRVVELSLDGQPIALGAEGGFQVRRGVPLGESRIALVAVDEWGNRADRVVRVVRRRPAAAQVAIARDSVAPVIEVPARIETAEATVALAGKVADASRVVELSVDGRPMTLAPDGSFAVKRGVAVGDTVLRLAAVDEWGNRSERQVQVTRVTPAASLGIDLGRYHALVIGNDDYRHLPKLNTAVRDATAVAEVLRRDYGFEVELLLDAARHQITAAVSRLRRELTERDNLLVYYAGHGVLDHEAEAGFWLPVDAERDSDSFWIANDYLTRNLRALSAKHVMVVADSCYSGTLVRAAPAKLTSAHERTAWLARMAEKRSRTALVSGGLEPVLDSGGGAHSVFAKAFLAALEENDGVLDGQGLFAQLRRPVVVNSDQTPDYSDIRRAGHDGGDFLFVRQ